MLDDFFTILLADVIAIPISYVLATPFILILSFFGKDNYIQNAKNYYKKIKQFIKNNCDNCQNCNHKH